MPKLLTKLKVTEVSSVDRGAGENCKIVLMKRADDGAPTGYFFNDIMRKNADEIQRPNAPTDAPKAPLSEKLEGMVDAMLLAAPTLDRQAAHHYLTETAHGRRLAEHLNNLSKGETPMPQVNIQKLIETLEQSLMAQVAKRDGESYAQSFSRKFESDIDFRKQWRDLTDVKLGFADTATTTTAAAKGMTPTSTSVGSSLVADDSAEAVRSSRFSPILRTSSLRPAPIRHRIGRAFPMTRS